MKLKVVSVIILIAVCCMCFVGCCAKRLQLNENSSAKLEYSCPDESKNFNLNLDGENSEKLIKELNKITYAEVGDDIVFEPSYDSLLITAGQNKIALYDVNATLSNGGFFTYNGQLCKTDGSFAFLRDYIEI